MNAAFVGSRNFIDREVIRRSILRLQEKFGDDLVIVSGGAKGADAIAENIAYQLGIKTTIIYPDWDGLGRGAGFIRNGEIVAIADAVFAFFAAGKRTPGTSNTVALAKGKGIPVYIYHEGRWS